MRSVRTSLMMASLLAFSAVAWAQGTTVKEGVDAWQAGDYGKAVGAWRGPAIAGDPDAQFNLAQAYKLGRGVPADLRAAQEWYQKAAVQGHEQAQANLGLILFQNGDRRGALPWIEKAAERGEPRAQYVLGTALFNGDLLPKDWVRAYALMTRAAASGLPQATTSLSQMDQYVPVGQRQKGLALARDLEKMAKVTAPAPAPAVIAAPKPEPAPTPVKVAKAASAPKSAPKAATLASKASPPAKPAAPAPARAAPVEKPSAPAASGAWRIQLGAFSTPASARSAWSSVGLQGLQPFIVKAGSVHRLQAGPFATRAAAEKACAQAKAKGAACFPVRG